VNLNKRPDTSKLREKLRSFFINEAENNFFNNFEVLKATTRQEAERLKEIDLLAEKIAAQVFVEKRNIRSKNFNSLQLYEAISAEIRRALGPPPNQRNVVT
jgi:hypothetical protein